MSLADDPARTVHPLLEVLFAGFEQAGLPWCLLRGEEELAVPSGDVDLLVAHHRRRAARAAVAAAGYAPLRRWGGGAQAFFVAYDEATDLWLRLHVTTRASFGRFYDLDSGLAAGVLARADRRRAVPVPAADDDFWLRLLHCLLDKHAIAPKHRAHLARLAPMARDDGPPGTLVTAMSPAGWDAPRIRAAARGEEWEALEALGGALGRSWRRAQPLASAARAVRNAVSLYARKVVEPVTRRGLAVAVLGPDGAGKSTVTRTVAASTYLPARVVYLGLYPLGRRARLERLPGGGTLLRLLRLWRSWLVVCYHRARRRLVLLDRHPYDGLAAPATDGGGRASARRRLLARSLPAPDLVVVLDAPGAVLFARSGEHDPQRLEGQRRRYRRLASTLEHVEVVDAAADPDVVRRRVTAAIWRRYRERHEST